MKEGPSAKDVDVPGCKRNGFAERVCSQDCGTIAHHPQIMAAASSQSALAEDVFSELDGINEADIDA